MPRVIKRYDNRKLYDVEAKRYVRLSELADLIRSGQDVQVIDNASGEDITANILSKTISERAEADNTFLPSRLLHEILRAGGNLVAGGVNQIDQTFDRIIDAAVERAGPSRALRQEVEQLRERVAQLEALIQRLEREKLESEEDDGRNDNGRRDHRRAGE